MKVLAVLGLAVALLSGCGGSTTAQPAPTVTVIQEVPAPTVTVTRIPADAGSGLRTEFEDGTWTAGEDIQAGTYKTAQECSNGYWKITEGGSNGNDIVANDPVDGGFGKFTVKKGEVVTVRRCGLWVRQS